MSSILPDIDFAGTRAAGINVGYSSDFISIDGGQNAFCIDWMGPAGRVFPKTREQIGREKFPDLSRKSHRERMQLTLPQTSCDVDLNRALNWASS